jgi:hypothetical protein
MLFYAIGLSCLGVIHSSPPKYRTALSASLADVRAAIEAANPGDTVIVPNGSATWDSQLVINKGITLQAESVRGVTITAGWTGQNYMATNFLIMYTPSNPAVDTFFRLSGFVLDCGSRVEGLELYTTTATPVHLRIDHCTFQHFQTDSTAAMIEVQGPLYGVVDNCIFYADDTETQLRLIYPSGSIGGDGGKLQWKTNPYESGDGNNLYFEDNTFYFWNIISTNGAGGRYCYRYNTFNYTGSDKSKRLYMFDNHGNMQDVPGGWGNYSGMGAELYENTINTGTNAVNLMDMRGGKGLIYNNYVTGTEITAQTREEFHDSGNLPAVHPINGQPQHVSVFYVWNNYLNGTPVISAWLPVISGTLDYADSRLPGYDASLASYGVVPREDIHCWRHKIPFDGSTGIGVGLLKDRPVTCAPGVAYWATDEKKLYRCTSPNVWTLYYTPYAYPHPLRTLPSV